MDHLERPAIHIIVFQFFSDPYRWVPSYGKPTIQSSTNDSHVASYATDGDYNKFFLPVNYSKTTISDSPYLRVDLGKKMPVNFLIIHFPMISNPAKIYQAISVELSTFFLYQNQLQQSNWLISAVQVPDSDRRLDRHILSMAVCLKPIRFLRFSCILSHTAFYIPPLRYYDLYFIDPKIQS